MGEGRGLRSAEKYYDLNNKAVLTILVTCGCAGAVTHIFSPFSSKHSKTRRDKTDKRTLI